MFSQGLLTELIIIDLSCFLSFPGCCSLQTKANMTLTKVLFNFGRPCSANN